MHMLGNWLARHADDYASALTPCIPSRQPGWSPAHLKWVASCVLRTGSMSTSFTTTLTSEPEKPSVRRPSSSKSGLAQAVGRVPQVHLEHVRPGRRLWQWDVDALHAARHCLGPVLTGHGGPRPSGSVHLGSTGSKQIEFQGQIVRAPVGVSGQSVRQPAHKESLQSWRSAGVPHTGRASPRTAQALLSRPGMPLQACAPQLHGAGPPPQPA